jgi:hypothetical protein
VFISAPMQALSRQPDPPNRAAAMTRASYHNSDSRKPSGDTFFICSTSAACSTVIPIPQLAGRR